MQMAQASLLSREQMETQIAQIDLLMGTYPGDDEVLIDAVTTKHLENLRLWTLSEDCSDTDVALEAVPSALSIEMQVSVSLDQQIEYHKSIRQRSGLLQLNVDIPVRLLIQGRDAEQEHNNAIDDSLPPPFKIRLRQPTWMNRTDTTKVNTMVAQEHAEDDFVTVIDRFCAETAPYLAYFYANGTVLNTTTPSTSATLNTDPTPTQESLNRVWFYFPSLSTRSKRNDLVNHAPSYSLTGFVLAGKPGVLCLEGTERNIDEYMRFIKTESWGDIPSHHKKVSERYREVIGHRVFEGMQEITDSAWMGEKRGERGNRNDLRALEGWLDGLGLKGVFEKVLF